jgi:hypothetical protein
MCYEHRYTATSPLYTMNTQTLPPVPHTLWMHKHHQCPVFINTDTLSPVPRTLWTHKHCRQSPIYYKHGNNEARPPHIIPIGKMSQVPHTLNIQKQYRKSTKHYKHRNAMKHYCRCPINYSLKLTATISYIRQWYFSLLSSTLLSMLLLQKFLIVLHCQHPHHCFVFLVCFHPLAASAQ